MCRFLSYPTRFAGLICKMIGLLVLAVLVYAIGGCIGTYEVLFADIDVKNNKTSSMEKAVQIIQTAYKLGEIPSAFNTWGITFAVVYVVCVVIIGIVLCAKLAHTMGHDLDTMGRSVELANVGERQNLRKDYEKENSAAL